MKVFVSDDLLQHRLWLKKIIVKQLDQLQFRYQLEDVWEPQDILEIVQTSAGPNIYFLDIDLKLPTNGIELASKIRDYDPNGFVVYITVRDDMMPLTLSKMTTPTGFISKQHMFDEEHFAPELQAVLQVIQQRLQTLTKPVEQTLELQSGATLLKLRTADVLYCEKVHGLRKSRIVTSHNEYLVHKNLGDIKAQLTTDNFFKEFQSYVINLDKVVTVDFNKGTIAMINGDHLTLSRGTIKKLREYIAAQGSVN